MVRALLYMLISIALITFLRVVIGLIGKTFSDLVQPQSSKPAAPPGPASLARELKRDPVCGTYVSEATSVKKTVGGEVVHFCSTACRDRHNA